MNQTDDPVKFVEQIRPVTLADQVHAIAATDAILRGALPGTQPGDRFGGCSPRRLGKY